MFESFPGGSPSFINKFIVCRIGYYTKYYTEKNPLSKMYEHITRAMQFDVRGVPNTVRTCPNHCTYTVRTVFAIPR